MTVSDIVAAAIDDHRAGRLAEAEAGYREVLSIEPTQFDALHLLGVIHHQRGEHREAIGLIRRALEREPAAYPALTNLGIAHYELDELEAARACLERAVETNPDYALAYEHLAVLLRRQGDSRGALAAFERVASLLPESAAAQNNLGIALHELGRVAAAQVCYAKALELDPGFAGAALNMGEALRLQRKHAESIAYCRRAISASPDSAQTHYNLGIALHVHGRSDEGLQAIETALALDPEHVEARWAQAMLRLPPVHEPGRPPEESLAAFARELEALDAWFTGQRVHRGYMAVGSQTPFYLAYHERNHVALLSVYGDLCARLMRQWQSDQGFQALVGEHDNTIKLAVVSGHVFDHSVWTAITRGLCEHLDRSRVSIHVFYTGMGDDHETATARVLASSFAQGQRPLQHWVKVVSQLRPDVILFPEVGMDPMTAKLAALRLAPVQLVAWGHPITTGLPTIDCYLSATAFEPDGAQAHYRERLIALPNLGCSYRPLEVVPKPPNVPGLSANAGAPVLICAGTPYKFTPEHDRLYVEIALRLGRAKLVFFEDDAEQPSKTLQRRLGAAFEHAGLDPHRFLYLAPRQERSAFFGLMQTADVYLDTPGFSGFNTAMQAIECGLPVVTQWGKFMRGRFAAGILAQMGLDELIAHTQAEYVDIVARLCIDAGFRADVRARITKRKYRLYDDGAPARAFEKLLAELTRRL